MTALSYESKGRLSQILSKWQGQQVSLTAASGELLITPSYLQSSLSYSDGFQESSTFGQILRKRKNLEKLPVHTQYSDKKNKSKRQNKTYHDQNDYVFKATETQSKKKGRLFADLAQQYKNRQKNIIIPKKRNQCFIAEDYGKYIKTEEQVLDSISEQSLDDKAYEPEQILSQISVFNQEIMKKIKRQKSEDFSQIMDEIKVATEKIIENRSKKKQQRINFQSPSLQMNSNEQIFSFQGALNISQQTTEQYEVLLNGFQMKESQYPSQVQEKKPKQNNSEVNQKEQQNEKKQIVKTYKIEVIDRRVKETNVVRLSPIRFRSKQQQIGSF